MASMLEPKNDRLCYGEQLTPPDGFDFDAAIATTYSLDLNALLAVPIALCFRDTLDGDLKGEKLALLEAIGQVKGRLKVFYQKGNISYPPKFNRLYTFLEPCLQAVVPEGGAFSSFHPKLWLLRFVEAVAGNKKAEVRYRLIVLSRNLTLDRSWDVAVTLDGVVAKTKVKNSAMQSLHVFIEKLMMHDKSFLPGSTMLQELRKVDWQIPEPFNDYQLLIGGGGLGQPLRFDKKDYDDVLVVSPFLKSTGGGIAALDDLATLASDKTHRWLFSQTEELDAIGEEKLSDWQCFAMNPSIVNGEELHDINSGAAQRDIKTQSLHAKLIVARSGNHAVWHMGSANATTAALGGADSSTPRNTEAMLMLSGNISKRNTIGPQQLLEEWMPEKGSQVFVAHEFSELDAAKDESQTQLLRQTVHQLISGQWVLDAKLDASGCHYRLTLKTSIDGINYNKVTVTVGQLDIAGTRELAQQMLWEDVELTSISALLPITVKVNNSDLQKRLIIAAKLTIEGGDTRQQQVMREMVDTPAKVMDYLSLLLQVSPDKNDWLGSDSQTGKAGDAESFILSDSPVFEQLLIASSRHPQVLKRIHSAIKRLKQAGADIPHEFLMLWKHFEKDVR